jgi:1-acyl-sn-glycerol-3-phosphate acyltransferase
MMDRPDWDNPWGTSGMDWAVKRLLIRPSLSLAMKAAAVALMDLHWTGTRHIPADGPCIFAANHVSLLDPPLLTAAVHEASRRQVRCIAWEGAARGWMGVILHLYGGIPLRKGGVRPSDLRRVLLHIEQGETLAIWPEGGISRDGRLGIFHPGLAWILRHAACPVIPATILGTRQAWPRHRPLFRPWKVRVLFHPAMHPDPETLECREGREAFMEALRRPIASGLPGGVADLPPDEAPPWWPL